MQEIAANHFLDFNVYKMMCELSRCGAYSFLFLDERFRKELAAYALQLPFMQRKSVTASGVYQELSACDTFPKNSIFIAVKNHVQALLIEKLKGFTVFPFAIPLDWNDITVQRYEAGSAGIRPHRDYKTLRNLICVIVLQGVCRFCVCGDRSGSDAEEIDATPGRAIMIRAAGFLGNDTRPFHFIDQIQELRITLGFRQETVERIYE